MEINLNNQSLPQSTLSGAKAVDFPAAKKSDVQKEPVGVPAVEKGAQPASTDAKRQAQVERAAQQLFKDVFAVSDTKFTIFKDSTGQFVTRFTSLRDGRVTYIPEPDIVRFLESKGAAREALIAIEA
ncbi:MAG: hypothetical protein CMM94_01865 [Rickettsiales bacterium]|nr:hypothetical protein [Rickettsiales bacterium]